MIVEGPRQPLDDEYEAEREANLRRLDELIALSAQLTLEIARLYRLLDEIDHSPTLEAMQDQARLAGFSSAESSSASLSRERAERDR